MFCYHYLYLFNSLLCISFLYYYFKLCALFHGIIRDTEYFQCGSRRVLYCLGKNSWKNCCTSNFTLPLLLLSPSSHLHSQLLNHYLITDRTFSSLKISFPKSTVRLLVSSSYLTLLFFFHGFLATPSSGSSHFLTPSSSGPVALKPTSTLSSY